MDKSAVLSTMLVLPLLAAPLSASALSPSEQVAANKLSPFVICDLKVDTVADVDVHASTLGLGLGVAFPVNQCLAVRAGFNQYNYSLNTSTGGANSSVSYAGTLKLSSYDAMLDWFPFHGYTHLTAGVVYNQNKFDLTSSGPFTLNGVQYTTGAINASLTFRPWAPYLGIGWSGKPSRKGWSFKSDLGVLFQGAPSSTLTTNNAAATAALAAEQAQLNDKLRHYRYYPVVAIGLGYAF